MNATTESGREPLVLIHGFGATARCWETLTPLLEDRYDVTLISLRGHFGGQPLEKGTRATISALADAVEEDLDAAGIDTAHICGNSLGGWLALELGARGRARTIVALAPGGGWNRLTWPEWRLLPLFTRMRIATRIGRLLSPWLMKSPLRRRAAMRDACERGDKLSPELATHFIEGFSKCKLIWKLLWGETISKMTKSTPVDCPTTIVWGNKDRILPIKICTDRWRRELPNAQWDVWIGVGHMPMVDDPERTAATIDAVVESTRGERVAQLA